VADSPKAWLWVIGQGRMSYQLLTHSQQGPMDKNLTLLSLGHNLKVWHKKEKKKRKTYIYIYIYI
jgi:hypothetical protein